MIDRITPFHLSIPQSELDELQRRLAATRWPERETVDDWSQGAPLARVQALCEYWRSGYDWRRCEAMLNKFGQYRTVIDGLSFHFLHIRSPHEDALPLIMTHGWPGSVIEFMKVVGALTDPTSHGGAAGDAFHLVLPSLPGYGFSEKPARVGWGIGRIAQAWIELMRRLGYSRYVAQGGDWGAAVTTELAIARPPGCAAVHLNVAIAQPTPEQAESPTSSERAAMDDWQRFASHGQAYAMQQSTYPQTLGYGLADSPAGQAAWIYEKFHGWTDNKGNPEDTFSMDEMLDNIMLYWLPGNGASSARLYWESLADGFLPRRVEMPVGLTIFPKEILRPSRRWAENVYGNIIHWSEVDKGGHFAAFEQPALFVDEIRACFREIR
jgi:pimeloyl-ACP methyl ester carboxylesterase